VGGGDVADVQVSDDRIGETGEGPPPLQLMGRGSPGMLVLEQEHRGDLTERLAPSQFGLTLLSFPLSLRDAFSLGFQWIDPVEQLLPEAARLIPCFGQRDGVERASPHFMAHAAQLVAERP
jgi:hypothetical protein